MPKSNWSSRSTSVMSFTPRRRAWSCAAATAWSADRSPSHPSLAAPGTRHSAPGPCRRLRPCQVRCLSSHEEGICCVLNVACAVNVRSSVRFQPLSLLCDTRSVLDLHSALQRETPVSIQKAGRVHRRCCRPRPNFQDSRLGPCQRRESASRRRLHRFMTNTRPIAARGHGVMAHSSGSHHHIGRRDHCLQNETDGFPERTHSDLYR